MRCPGGQLGWVTVVMLVSSCTCKDIPYELDQICRQNNARIIYMKDEEVIVVHGKTTTENDFHDCMLKFSPGFEAKKKTIKITFNAYNNDDCRVFLAAQQSPKMFFESDVSLMFNFTCRSMPRKNKSYFSDAGNFVQLNHHRKDVNVFNYNFLISISLTELTGVGPDHEVNILGMSNALIICIAILIVITIVGAVCIMYRCRKIKHWKERHQYDDRSSMNSPQYNSRTGITARYTDLPNEMAHRDSIHSQACILGSVTADGTCTICNRKHDDFAHMVDVNALGDITQTVHSHHDIVRPSEDSPRDSSSRACILGSQSADGVCTVCNRHHEDFAHIVDVSHDGIVQETVHSHPDTNRNHLNPVHTSSPRLNRVQGSGAGTGLTASSNNRSNQPGSGTRTAPSGGGHIGSRGNASNSTGDDDDIDLVGNDLIPPSYDLSPPSYDEAVNMPKPNTDVSSSLEHQNDDADTDPLYQNIDGLARDLR